MVKKKKEALAINTSCSKTSFSTFLLLPQFHRFLPFFHHRPSLSLSLSLFPPPPSPSSLLARPFSSIPVDRSRWQDPSVLAAPFARNRLPPRANARTRFAVWPSRTSCVRACTSGGLMGPANDYWPADLGGTRRTCPLVHKPSVCGADSRDRGASSNISFPLPDLSWGCA